MKKFFFFAATVLTGLSFASCNREALPSRPVSSDIDGEEIVLNVLSDNIDIQTKATAVTALPSSLYLCMTSGTAGASGEVSKMASTSKSQSSSKIATGLYQTVTPTAYNYYLCNAATSFTAGTGVTIACDGNTDIITGTTKASTSDTPSVSMGHIYARVGTVKMSSSSGYTLSGMTVTLTNAKTGGTYNLSSGSWTSTGTAASKVIASGLNGGTASSVSDLYLIPGTYAITVSGTQKLGDYSSSFTKNGTVTLAANRINNIEGSFSNSGASAINISVSLTPWSSSTATATF